MSAAVALRELRARGARRPMTCNEAFQWIYRFQRRVLPDLPAVALDLAWRPSQPDELRVSDVALFVRDPHGLAGVRIYTLSGPIPAGTVILGLR